jgi:hypothetical protein
MDNEPPKEEAIAKEATGTRKERIYGVKLREN